MPRMSYSRSVVGWKVWVQLISAELHVVAEETTYRIGEVGALQGVRDLGFQEAGLVTTVEAFAFVAQAVEGLLADQFGHAVGELDIAAGAAFHAGEVGGDLRQKDVADDGGQIKR